MDVILAHGGDSGHQVLGYLIPFGILGGLFLYGLVVAILPALRLPPMPASHLTPVPDNPARNDGRSEEEPMVINAS